jgi:DNA-directed RNA polymerase specialized sigma24 family protein
MRRRPCSRVARKAILNDAEMRQRDAPLSHESAWFDPPNRDYAAEMNLRRALAALSDDRRQVTVLHIWGELTFSEIGGVLALNRNTVASRYRYAFAKLGDTLCAQEEPCANP